MFCLCQDLYLTVALRAETDLWTKFIHNPQRIKQEEATKWLSFVLLSDGDPGLMMAAHYLNPPLYVQLRNINIIINVVWPFKILLSSYTNTVNSMLVKK